MWGGVKSQVQFTDYNGNTVNDYYFRCSFPDKEMLAMGKRQIPLAVLLKNTGDTDVECRLQFDFDETRKDELILYAFGDTVRPDETGRYITPPKILHPGEIDESLSRTVWIPTNPEEEYEFTSYFELRLITDQDETDNIIIFPKFVNSDKPEYNGLQFIIISEAEHTLRLVSHIPSYDGDIPAHITWDNKTIYTVTEIGDHAFIGGHPAIRIPSTIKKIGSKAFDTRSLSLYTDISNPSEISIATDAFVSNDYNNIYVPKESEDEFLISPEWGSNCNIIGYISDNGLSYYLNNYFSRMDNLPWYMGKQQEFIGSEFTIPAFLIYDGIEHPVFYIHLNEKNCKWFNQAKIINAKAISVENAPNIEQLNVSECNVYNCPVLSKITINNSGSSDPIQTNWNRIDSCYEANCPSLKEIKFQKRLHEFQYGGFPFFGTAQEMDIYFSDNIPPSRFVYAKNSRTEKINPNLILHVPSGSKDAYTESDWHAFNIVDDSPKQPIYLEYGYNGNDQPIGVGWAVGCGDNDVEFAMRIPSEYIAPYKGAKISAISLDVSLNPVSFDIPNYVFITKEGSDEYLTKEPFYFDGTISTIQLSHPVEITGETLFVGIGRKSRLECWSANENYSPNGFWVRAMGNDYSVGQTPGVWEQGAGQGRGWCRPMPLTCRIEGEGLPTDITILSTEIVENVPNEATMRRAKAQEKTNRAPILSPTELSRYGTYICETTDSGEIIYKAADVTTESNQTPKKASATDNSSEAVTRIKTTVQNRTTEKVSNFRIKATENGKPAIDTIIRKTLMPNQAAEIMVEFPIIDRKSASHSIVMDIPEIDGKPDGIPANSASSFSFNKIIDGVSYPRRTVVEEGTGTWCGYCPAGIVAMEKMAEKYPDNFIGIAVHKSDEMGGADNYDTLLGRFLSYPNSLTNRKEEYLKSPDTKTLDAIISAETAKEAIAAIEVSATIGGDCQNATVTTVSRFGYDTDDNNVRIAYVVTEDNVGPYNQGNYYDDSDLEGWAGKGHKVLTVFNDVARGIYDYNGIEGSTPASVEIDRPYESQYTLTLPENIDNLENINIIAMLIDGKTGEILNADKAKPEIDMSGLDRCIEDEKACATEIEAIYTVDGIRLERPATGRINIVVFSDGTRTAVIP